MDAYCEPEFNCEGGPPTDANSTYLSGLYVCLPADAYPKQKRQELGGGADYTSGLPSGGGGGGGSATDETTTESPWVPLTGGPATTAAGAGPSSAASVSPPAATGTGTGTGKGCGGADTGPHKLELLCTCDGFGSTPEAVCINPPGDHLGGCAIGCGN